MCQTVGMTENSCVHMHVCGIQSVNLCVFTCEGYRTVSNSISQNVICLAV